uniref:MIF4G domain-containing protein n=1 Tax=Amblyomma maculatum TaxID=34609 RepID=G3MPG0_AMBMU
MAGRGRGTRAAFPEVRHQLRRPKDDCEKSVIPGPGGDASPDGNTPLPPAPVKEENDEIKKLCTQFKYLDATDPNFSKHLTLLTSKLTSSKDVEDTVNTMYELCLLGPEQAEVTCQALVQLCNVEVDGVKLRSKVLTKMQHEFEGFEEKAESSPQLVISNAIFLCEFYTRYLVQGKPVNPLRGPLWKYLEFMLQSRKPYFISHCLRLVQNKMGFFVTHNRPELESDYLKLLRDVVLDEKVQKVHRSLALDTLECALKALMLQKGS